MRCQVLKFNKTRVIRIAIAAFFTLIILFLGQYFYEYRTEKLLVKKLMENEFIKSVEIVKDVEGLTIVTELDQVNNLMAVYKQIEQDSRKYIKDNNLIIQFINKTDNLIETVYENDVQFILYEALQRGNFTEMRDKLDILETANGISIKTFLDSENIYVQISHGTFGFYNVVKR